MSKVLFIVARFVKVLSTTNWLSKLKDFGWQARVSISLITKMCPFFNSDIESPAPACFQVASGSVEEFWPLMPSGFLTPVYNWAISRSSEKPLGLGFTRLWIWQTQLAHPLLNAKAVAVLI